MQSNLRLKTAIENADLISARAIILASFRTARNEKNYQFIEWVNEAKLLFQQKDMRFFDEDDDVTEFTHSNEQWDEELWKTLRVEVEYNFSQKKLDALVAVMDHLRKSGHPDFQVKTVSVHQSKANSPQETKSATPTQLKTGVVAGAAVGFAIGMFIGRPIIGSVVGAAIGGGIGNSLNGSKE
ncbi:hypothetical protein [Colwellia sp. BRX8-9]|uniref:hypothetical protein n=1 Tax=Colwellia sp. BRX8-9 TaxID=2759831 RepID=UPI0015F66C94|nr:hypothetical protein [Colwellia sp. BRX8-9]MBA6350077.1 hypothetical protein [Colwellia sp. BRX8-9]